LAEGAAGGAEDGHQAPIVLGCAGIGGRGGQRGLISLCRFDRRPAAPRLERDDANDSTPRRRPNKWLEAYLETDHGSLIRKGALFRQILRSPLLAAAAFTAGPAQGRLRFNAKTLCMGEKGGSFRTDCGFRITKPGRRSRLLYRGILFYALGGRHRHLTANRRYSTFFYGLRGGVIVEKTQKNLETTAREILLDPLPALGQRRRYWETLANRHWTAIWILHPGIQPRAAPDF